MGAAGRGGSRTMGAARKRRGENVSDGNGEQGASPKERHIKGEKTTRVIHQKLLLPKNGVM